MDTLRTIVEAGPVPADVQWRTVITAEAAFGTAVGALGGATIASLVVEPLLYPGELQAVGEAETQLQKAKIQQAHDEQTLANVEGAAGKHNPLTDQFRDQVATDKQTVATVQHRLDALPNHSTAVSLDGLGIGVAVGLVTAGIRLGVRRIRTARAGQRQL